MSIMLKFVNIWYYSGKLGIQNKPAILVATYVSCIVCDRAAGGYSDNAGVMWIWYSTHQVAVSMSHSHIWVIMIFLVDIQDITFSKS